MTCSSRLPHPHLNIGRQSLQHLEEKSKGMWQITYCPVKAFNKTWLTLILLTFYWLKQVMCTPSLQGSREVQPYHMLSRCRIQGVFWWLPLRMSDSASARARAKVRWQRHFTQVPYLVRNQKLSHKSKQFFVQYFTNSSKLLQKFMLNKHLIFK